MKVLNVHNLCRSLLDDIPGNIWSDDVLLPLTDATYRELQERLAENGITTMAANIEFDVPADTTVLNASSSPALPGELIVPHRMWELPAGSTARYIQVTKAHEQLPDLEPTQDLRYWDWLDGEIHLIGATRIVPVRLRYEHELPALELLGTGSEIKIRGALNALAYGTAAKAPGGKTKNLGTATEREINSLIARHIRPEQRRARRRIPYGFRGHSGGRSSDFY